MIRYGPSRSLDPGLFELIPARSATGVAVVVGSLPIDEGSASWTRGLHEGVHGAIVSAWDALITRQLPE